MRPLITGVIKQPPRVLLYGPEGVGKSTFAAGAPRPIFLGTEDGTAQLDVTRFPAPATWQDALKSIEELTVEPHEFGTLVIDTLDWLEPLLHAYICKRDNQPTVEAYGYGKGYVAALDEWRVLLAALERLRAKGLAVLLLAHTAIKPYKNPMGDDYDRWELKLNGKASGLLKEWSDAVLFANFETFAVRDKKDRVRGIDNGSVRLMYTERRAAYDAKNRYGLPDHLPLSWAALQQCMDGDLSAEITRKAEKLPAALKADALGALKRAGDDVAKLRKLNQWITNQEVAQS